MEFETVALENSEVQGMNLGNGQLIYDDYLRVKEAFQAKLATYQALVAELKSRKSASITTQEMRRVDALAEEIGLTEKQCREKKDALLRILESLLLESRGMERDVAYHAKEFRDEDKIEWVHSLVEESLRLRNDDELARAIEKAYQAKEFLATLLSNANSGWIQQHQKKAETWGREG